MNSPEGTAYTAVPNALFDWLPLMKDAELRVVLHVVRQTIGFHKTNDAISFSQFMKATGLSRQGVFDGLAAARTHGLILEVGRGKRGVFIYQPCLDTQPSTGLPTRPVQQVDQSTNLTSSGLPTRPQSPSTGLPTRNTKEKELKETSLKKERVVQRPEPTTDPAFIERKLYYRSFEMGFPENAPIRVADTKRNQQVAAFLYANGYQPLDVIPLVKAKITGGRSDYQFAYLEEDMPREKVKQIQSKIAAKSAPVLEVRKRPADMEGYDVNKLLAENNFSATWLPPLVGEETTDAAQSAS